MYCIYQITNKINGKRYIGQHKYEDESNPMGKYKGSGLNLHRAYKKYGIENFETEILYKRVRDKSTIDAMEIWAIEKYKPEYNIAKGGTGGDIYHCVSPDIQYKMAHSNQRRFSGHKHSEESKIKTSNKLKGRKFSEETLKRMSKANKGKNNSQYGKHWFTNGTNNICTHECPVGYYKGRIVCKRG